MEYIHPADPANPDTETMVRYEELCYLLDTVMASEYALIQRFLPCGVSENYQIAWDQPIRVELTGSGRT